MQYWSFCVCFALVGVSVATLCDIPKSKRTAFSIISRRNFTGHWVAQVNLGHPAELKDDGQWEVNVDHVTEKCEYGEYIMVTATVAAPNQSPGSNYQLLPGLGYYNLHYSDMKSWNDAKHTCEQEGAHLAIPNSEKELQQIRRFWISRPKEFDDWRNTAFQVGIHDQFKEGELATIFGEPYNLSGVFKWQHQEPNGGNRENCVCMNYQTGELIDIGCAQYKIPFLCKKEL